MNNIEHAIDITAPASSVLAALTTHDGIRGWFTDDVTCDRERRQSTFRFDKKVGSMEVTFRIEQADERGVVMTCIAERDNPEWRDTRLAYELAPTPGGTRVRLVHSGFRGPSETYDMTTKGWAAYLGSLKRYVETGKGNPHVPAK